MYAPSDEPRCVAIKPVFVRVSESLSSDRTKRKLLLPYRIVDEVDMANLVRVKLTAEFCGGTPPTVGALEESIGFPALDDFLAAHLSELALDVPAAKCINGTIVVSGFGSTCVPHQATM